MASTDAQQNKTMGILAYILFFIPLLAAPKSTFAKYHANQGLILLILAIAVQVVGGVVPFLGWFLVLPIGNIAVLVFFVMGIINASNGVMKPLPLIGGFTLIK
jgi:uncharacterized membrane protein